MDKFSPGGFINYFLLLPLLCSTYILGIFGASVKEIRHDFSVIEGVDPGTVVGRLNLDRTYTYRLNDQNAWFEFDAKTGEITCTSRLDRESLPSDRLDLVVLGNPSRNSDPTLFISVRVTVDDVNDNVPAFPFPFQNISVPESAKIGSQLVLPSATDPDAGENGRIAGYRIISGNDDGVFKLSRTAEDRQQSTGTLLLLLDKELDRESKSLYNINISATDAGHPTPLSGYLTLFVNVLDANDNAPTFDKDNFHVTVTAKVTEGQPILTVSATDNDNGQNARISYHLTNAVDGQFEIEPATGVIKSKVSKLSCPESHCSNGLRNCSRLCILSVEAVDGGVPSQRGRAFVHVKLKEENDHTPDILFRMYPSAASQSAIVSEEKPIGHVVAVVTVVDNDVGDNGDTDVTIEDGNQLNHFRLESNEEFSLLRINAPLDRKKIAFYNLSISATDHGTPPKKSQRFLPIYVRDANDKPPEFTAKSYSANISNTAPVGSYVMALTANHIITASSGPNFAPTQLTFDILSGNEKGLVGLDPRTGLVTVADRLAAYGNNVLNLRVSVKGTTPGDAQGSVAKLKINILDNLNNAPVFSRTIYDVSLREDAIVGTTILHLTASDVDSGLAGQLQFAISPDFLKKYPEQFKITPDSGVIRLGTSLDREIVDIYRIPVIVHDLGTPQLFAESEVLLRVEDINDNRPLVYPTDYYINALSSVSPGSLITVIQATDADASVNGQVQYSLVDSPPGLFSIDRSTGRLTLLGKLSAPSKVTLTVAVSDAGNQQAANNATVHIYAIQDLALQPVFKDRNYEFSIFEDSGEDRKVGRVIGTVSATDFDKTTGVQYYLVGGDKNGLFEIGQFSGEIRGSAFLDREKESTYNLAVICVGKGAVAETVVSVHLEDINDNQPLFISHEIASGQASTVVHRDWPIGYAIFHASATDEDTGDNGLLTYSMIAETEGLFTIENDTGLVALAVPGVLLPKQDRHRLTIQVSDAGIPTKTNAFRLYVNILPRIVQADTVVLSNIYLNYSIPENTPVNTLVDQLKTTPELGHNLKFLDRSQEPFSPFGIFPDGWLYVKTPLDYERKNYYSMNVLLEQNGHDNETITSSALVHFVIIDVNDNAPFCSNQSPLTVPENLPPLSYVGTVLAEDRDTGLNGKLVFKLLTGSDQFLLDSSSGELTLLNTFDRESLQRQGSTSMFIRVEISDQGDEPHVTECELEVKVIDENDEQPQFSLEMYYASIPEDTPVGNSILQVTAMDADDGLNAAVSYQISSGNNDGQFNISQEDGRLTLAKPLDRELIQEHRLTISAQDSGVPPLNATTHATIMVTDVNDEAPQFIEFPTHGLNVSESTPVGTFIAQFTAVDSDLGAGGSVQYLLTSGNIGNVFELDSQSGTMHLVRPLDFERIPAYTLTITASDLGSPSLRSTVPLLVNVIDSNDSPPVITSTSLIGEVQEDVPIGSPVLQVTATDADYQLNGQIKYELLEQNPTEAFKINAQSGLITTSSLLDRESIASYSLKLRASDSAQDTSMQLFTERTVTIIVTDANDHAPEFIGPHAAVINLSDVVNRRIAKVFAADADSGLNASIGFRVLDGNSQGLFKLDSDGGLFLRKQINNAKPMYHITLEAMDRVDTSNIGDFGGHRTTSMQFTLITLGPTNAGLRFSEDEYLLEIVEDTAIGTQIASLPAAFSDGKNRGKIQYFVTDFKAENASSSSRLRLPVDVEPDFGVLRVIRRLDRESTGGAVVVTVAAVLVDGQGPLATRCQVHIRIIDVNDEEPKPDQAQYVFQVKEDIDVGTQIGTVSGTDGDMYSKLTYSFKHSSNVFAINPKNGMISLQQQLDREKIDRYTNVVNMNDGLHSTFVPVLIEVQDVNDNIPEWVYPQSTTDYTFHVREGAQRNSFVGRIYAKDNDIGSNSKIRYEILSGNEDKAFFLDHKLGILGVNGFIDHEKQPRYTLEVVAVDGGSPAKRRSSGVVILVDDVNDNPPVFSPSVYEVSLFENATVRTALLQLHASDQDISNDLHYSITSGDPWHQFQVTSNGTLVLSAPLDRETRPSHQLTITVFDARPIPSDSDKTVHSSTATVTVTVLDVNDNAPRFTCAMNVAVAGTNPVGTLVTVLTAEDLDLGLNGQVQFQLDSASAGPFSVDPVLGHVTVNQPLNRLRQDQVNLTIWAVDSGSPDRMQTKGVLTVQIINNNLFAPTFKKPVYEMNVAEDTPPGTSLIQLSLSDTDVEFTSLAQFWVSSGDPSGDFLVTPDTGIVSVARQLDYERTPFYNLTVSVSNPELRLQGLPSDHFAQLLVTVIDVNDQGPVFRQNPLQIQVVENLAALSFPAVIGLVEAIDGDSGLSGKMSFSIISGNATVFRIDSMTGLLSLTTPLDREHQDTYTLVVQATDSGIPRQISKCTVHVEVLDANDNSPLFDKPYYIGAVPEDALPGSKVIQVHAEDMDKGKNGVVRYVLSETNEKSLPFMIDEEYGWLLVKDGLDREVKEEYIVQVIAEDGGDGIPKRTSTLITVEIEDVNDNTPAIANHQQREVFVQNTIGTGDFVYAIDAVDLDAGENSRLQFSVRGKDASFFEIDQSTGVIRAQKLLVSQQDYSLDIEVSDSGQPPRHSIAKINLHTRPAAEFPVFKSAGSVQSFQVSEYEYGAAIMVPVARSPKQPPFNRLQYSIIAGNTNAGFAIDPLSGKITSTDHLDRENCEKYELWISATDSDNPELTAYMPVSITVTDENDHAPRFSQPLYEAELNEDALPLTVVAKVEASDMDSGVNAELAYSILAEGNTDGAFVINSKTGEIRTADVLDREKVSSYRLIVQVKDGGVPTLNSQAVVVINVRDVNDNAPKFTRLFMASVPEDAAIGDVVTQVTSSDLDSQEYSNNTYYLTTNPGDKFAIDPLTGELTVVGPLDRESVAEYPLKVIAVDGSWRIETSVTITVDDTNDQVPQFSQRSYQFTIAELQPVLTHVGKVLASDSDQSGPNSQLSFSFLTPTKLFRIDPITGDITTLASLQFRDMDNNYATVHKLVVLASDHGTPHLENQADVTILVTRKNVHTPKFTQIEYETAVTTSTPIGSQLLQVKANDDDMGANGKITYEIQAKDQFGKEVIDIDSQTGWIRTKRSISLQENTQLAYLILAKDGGNPAKSVMAPLILHVAEINHHNPEFSSHRYEATVEENGPTGQSVLHVLATDKDNGINGKLVYSLEVESPMDLKLFKIEPTTGLITTNHSLDSEMKRDYMLTLVCEDKGWPKRRTEAQVKVHVVNKNDNAPMFSSPVIEAFVPENSPAGTLVYILSANDADKNIQDKILYAIIGGRGAEYFKVDEVTGQVIVAAGRKRLDYEQMTQYELKVQARNRLPDKSFSSGTISEAMLIIHVTSRNEFSPKFPQKYYSFRISTSSNMQRMKIGSVKALDADAGTDGIVYYYFGSKTDDFTIDQTTGDIFTSRKFYPTNEDAILTVVAKNRKSVSLADQDECQVQIIFDDDTKKIQFSQSTFNTQVSEDAPSGTSVLSLSSYIPQAAALNIQFSITDGNNNQAFTIDSTGFIQVSGRMDREQQDVYNLTVSAMSVTDITSSGSAHVAITILDVNDNSPALMDNNRVGRVMEGDPIGISIMRLSPVDADLDPNGPPYSFRIVDAPSQKYFNVDSTTGVIKSRAVFDREQQNSYEVMVEITDSGKPQRSSVIPVRIIVGDVNDSPSTTQDVHLQLIEVNKHTKSGLLAQAPPCDRDLTGNYNCRLVSAGNTGLAIDNNCFLTVNDRPRLQSGALSVYGSDGIHNTVNYSILVDYLLLSQENVQDTVELSISGDPEDFIGFFTQLNQWLNPQGYVANPVSFTIPDNLFLSTAKYTVFMSLTRSGDDQQIAGQTAFSMFLKGMGILNGLEKVTYNLCTQNSCLNGGTCFTSVLIQDTERLGSLRLQNGTHIIAYPYLERIQSCQCSPLFTGANCAETLDQCANGPCQNGGSCSPTADGKASCICPAGFDGDQCQNDLDECLMEPCRNGGFCENVHGSYKCICLMGYSGDDCQYTVDQCSSNPCLNGGECIKDGASFSCRCSLGYSGRKCKVKSYGFDVNSYVELPSLNPHQNLLSMEFATKEQNALLLYSYNSALKSEDYVAVDIVDGRIRLSARLQGQGQMNMMLSKPVADGQWHQIMIEHKFQVVTLSVADCSPEASLCQPCLPADPACSLVANTGLPQILVPGKSIFVGGVKNFDDLAVRPGQVSAFSFVGCMRSFEINGKSLQELETYSKMNVLDYCPRSEKENVCAEGSCGRAAIGCTDKWTAQLCACQDYVTATHCDTVFESREFVGGSIEYTLLESFRRTMLFTPVAPESLVNSDDLFRRQKRSIEQSPANVMISVDFKTTNPDGLLFLSSSGDDFTMIDLVNGSVRYLSRRLRSLPLSLVVESDSMNDDNWHRVELVLADQFMRVELRLDGKGKSIRVSNSLHPVIDISTRSIALGGTKNSLGGVIVQGSSIDDFTGCLRRFLINNEVQPLENGQSSYVQAEVIGQMGGSCGGESCTQPPCSGAGISAGLSRAVLIVVVFFTCLILCMLLAFIAMRRFKSIKSRSNSRSSSQPTHSTKLSHIAIISQSGMTPTAPQSLKPAQSGMHLLGDGLHSLIGSSHSSGRTNMQSQASRMTPPDLDPAMYGMQMGRAAYDNRLDPTFDEAEQYDLDNASSIAPSDIDVSYHYRGFRESLGKSASRKKKEHLHIMRNSSPLTQLQSLANRNSSSASTQPSSVKQLKAALRNSGGIYNGGSTGSSDEPNMQIRQPRSRAGSAHSKKSKKNDTKAQANTSYAKGSASKSNRAGVLSVKDLRRYHSNPSFDDDDGSSSSSYEQPDNRNSMGRRRGRKSGHNSSTTATPRILSRSTNRSHPADFSSAPDTDNSGDEASDVDVKRREVVETETESEFGTVPSSLAPFRPPRSMFPVSEDESASDLPVTRFDLPPSAQRNSRNGGMSMSAPLHHAPPIPPRLGKPPTPPSHQWPNKVSPQQALHMDGARLQRNDNEQNLEAYV